jgi:hypothetical protein
MNEPKKPRIKPLPNTGDAVRYLVNGEPTYISGCLMSVTRKHPLTLLGKQLKANAEKRP